MFQRILAVAILFLSCETFAQNFEAISSYTRLPVPLQSMPVVYDGEDSIYVLGGIGPNGAIQKDILKFSVTRQRLEKVGSMDPIAYGSAVWAGKEILYFGGYIGSERQGKIWRYKPDGARDWTQVGDLPSSATDTSSVWDQGEYSYVFGGYNGTRLNTISRFSRVTNTSVVVGELPKPVYSTLAVWDEATGDAYVFGGSGPNDIVKFNPAENTVLKLNVTPVWIQRSCAIWTGTEAYIIGGSRNRGNIVRFNPSTNEVLNVSVSNFGFLTQPGCAFVKKLNRIYVFGGVGTTSLRDEIRYIDLAPNPSNPTTACKTEVDGTRFPNPSCCENYYKCENQEAVLRQCPDQLQFNPSNGECELPEIVKCRTTYV